MAQNLSSLKRLKILSAQSNRITKIEGIEDLENLEDVYLSHNGIEKLEGFDKNVSQFLYSTELKLIASSWKSRPLILAIILCLKSRISRTSSIWKSYGYVPSVRSGCLLIDIDTVEQQQNSKSVRPRTPAKSDFDARDAVSWGQPMSRVWGFTIPAEDFISFTSAEANWRYVKLSGSDTGSIEANDVYFQDSPSHSKVVGVLSKTWFLRDNWSI